MRLIYIILLLILGKSYLYAVSFSAGLSGWTAESSTTHCPTMDMSYSIGSSTGYYAWMDYEWQLSNGTNRKAQQFFSWSNKSSASGTKYYTDLRSENLRPSETYRLRVKRGQRSRVSGSPNSYSYIQNSSSYTMPANDTPTVQSQIPDITFDGPGTRYKFIGYASNNKSSYTSTLSDASNYIFNDHDCYSDWSFSISLADGSAAPSWLSVNKETANSYGTKTSFSISGNPKTADEGTYIVRITANDSFGASVYEDFNLTVSNATDYPQLKSHKELGGGSFGISVNPESPSYGTFTKDLRTTQSEFSTAVDARGLWYVSMPDNTQSEKSNVCQKNSSWQRDYRYYKGGIVYRYDGASWEALPRFGTTTYTTNAQYYCDGNGGTLDEYYSDANAAEGDIDFTKVVVNSKNIPYVFYRKKIFYWASNNNSNHGRTNPIASHAWYEYELGAQKYINGTWVDLNIDQSIIKNDIQTTTLYGLDVKIDDNDNIYLYTKYYDEQNRKTNGTSSDNSYSSHVFKFKDGDTPVTTNLGEVSYLTNRSTTLEHLVLDKNGIPHISFNIYDKDEIRYGTAKGVYFNKVKKYSGSGTTWNEIISVDNKANSSNVILDTNYNETFLWSQFGFDIDSKGNLYFIAKNNDGADHIGVKRWDITNSSWSYVGDPYLSSGPATTAKMYLKIAWDDRPYIVFNDDKLNYMIVKNYSKAGDETGGTWSHIENEKFLGTKEPVVNFLMYDGKESLLYLYNYNNYNIKAEKISQYIDMEVPENTVNAGTLSSLPTTQTTIMTNLGGVDNDKLDFSNTTGSVILKQAPDFENPHDANTDSVFDFQVKLTDASDSSLWTIHDIRVKVVDGNEHPVFADGTSDTFTLNEKNITAKILQISDPENNNLAYTFSGADASQFEVDSTTKALKFKTLPNANDPQDSNSDNVYTVTVRATDDGVNPSSLYVEQTITVTVVDVPDTPEELNLSALSLNEGNGIGDIVGTLSTNDFDDPNNNNTYTYELVSGSGDSDNSSFSIDENKLKINEVTNYEGSPSKLTYVIRVKATDQTNRSFEDTFTISVNDVSPEPPMMSNASNTTIVENSTLDFALTAIDEDTDASGLTWSEVSTPSWVTFDNTTNKLTGIASTSGVYTANMKLSDGTYNTNQTITINVSNVNDAPIITNNSSNATSTLTLQEELTALTDINATDEDNDSISYTISGGADSSAFQIDPITGEISFKTAPDYESGKIQYIVEVSATDNGTPALSDTQTITVNITNKNDAPEFTNISSIDTPENNSTVATALNASDDDADNLAYSIISGYEDASLFTINSSTGVLSFVSAPDYETKKTYELKVRVTDDGVGTLYDEKIININITDINEAPIVENLDKLKIGEYVGAKGFGSSSAIKYTSMVVDSTGKKYLVYRDSGDNYKINVMVFNGTSWTDLSNNSDINSSRSDGRANTDVYSPKLAIDSSDNLYIAYPEFDSSTSTSPSSFGKATVLKYNGTSWDVIGSRGFSAATANNIDIQFDSNDVLHIVYKNASNNDIYFKKFDGTNWVDAQTPFNTTITGAQSISFVFDTNDNPYIVYRYNFQAAKAIYVLTHDGSSWSEITASNGLPTSTDGVIIHKDNAGKLYIGYKDGVSKEANLIKFDGTNWNAVGSANFTPADIWTYDFSFDSNNNIYFAYTDQGTSNKLSVMKYDGTSWSDFGQRGYSDGSTGYIKTIVYNDELNVAFADATNSGASVLKITEKVANINIEENKKLVTQVDATDPEAQTLYYTVLGGLDQTKFSFNGNNLVFNDINIPDYEKATVEKTDANSDNIYEVDIRVSDGINNTDRSISITITDAASETAFNSGNGEDDFDVSIDENTSSVTTLNAQNYNNATATVSYTITGGADSSLFDINSTTGELTLKVNADFENKSSLEVIITATADSETDTQTVNLSINDINETPSITSTAITIGTENTNYSYTITVTDQDNDSIGFDSSTLPSWLSINSSSAWDTTTSTDTLFTKDIGSWNRPSVVDLDGDGDMDVISGEYSGKFYYFENNGSNSFTYYSYSSASNPLQNIDIGKASSPVFIDIDNDGDLDMFSGGKYGKIYYYKNTGTSTSATFQSQSSSYNPFDGVDVGSYSTPTFKDIDNDGDHDVFIGNSNGKIDYFENTGTSTAPIFIQQTSTNNPINGVDVGSYSSPILIDMDKDSDMDLLVGESDGNFNYYKNIGTKTAPIFKVQINSDNPFNNIDLGYRVAPAFIDIDGDKDLDLISGDYYGKISLLKNNGGTILSGTPTASGVYSVNLVASDGEFDDTQNFDITVANVNDVPLFNDFSFVLSENSAVSTSVGTIIANDEDTLYSPNNETLTYSIESGNTNSDFSIDSSTGEIKVVNALNAYVKANYALGVKVTDSSSASDTANVTIAISDEVDTPVALDDTSSTNEDTAITINVSSNDSDKDNNLNIGTYTVSTAAINGITKVNTNGTIVYTPNANYNGTDSFKYKVYDKTGLVSNEAEVMVSITAVNDAPTTISTTTSTEEDISHTIDLEALSIDVDGKSDLDVYSIESGPSNGIFVLNGESLEYTPNNNFYGFDSFTFKVSDKAGLDSNISTVFINVAEINDIPEAFDNLDASTNEDVDLNIDVLSNDADDNGLDSTTVEILNTAKNGIVTVETNGTITYSPNANWYGTDSFEYTVKDDGVATGTQGTGVLISNPAKVIVTVASINDIPVAVDDSFTMLEDEVYLFAAHLNDTDVETLQLDGKNITIQTIASNGTTTVDSSGLIKYVPNQDYSGSDSITYKISDGEENSNEATISVTVTNVNDTPKISNYSSSDAQALDIDENISSVATYIVNDIENDTITYELLGVDKDLFTISNSGVLSFASAPNFERPVDSNRDNVYNIQVKVSDPDNAFDTQALTITVLNLFEMDSESDFDGDGVPDSDEGGESTDTDGDGIPNYKDDDTDGDGIPDGDEYTGDVDNDGIPDNYDDDTDNDGIKDKDDTDKDNDGIDDTIDGSIDVDNDGIPNYLDIDSDGDGKLDSVELTGDADLDGIVNFIDKNDNGSEGFDDNGDGTKTKTFKKVPGSGDDKTTKLTLPNDMPSDEETDSDGNTTTHIYDPKADITVKSDGGLNIDSEHDEGNHNIKVDNPGADVEVKDNGDMNITTSVVTNLDGSTCQFNLSINYAGSDMITKHYLDKGLSTEVLTTIIMKIPNSSIHITEDNVVEHLGTFDNNDYKETDVTGIVNCMGEVQTITAIDGEASTYVANNKPGSIVIIEEDGDVDTTTSLEQDPTDPNILKGLNFKIDSDTAQVTASKVFKDATTNNVTYKDAQTYLAGSNLTSNGTNIKEVTVDTSNVHIIQVDVKDHNDNTVSTKTNIDSTLNVSRTSSGEDGKVTSDVTVGATSIVIDNFIDGKAKHKVKKGAKETFAISNIEGAEIVVNSAGVTTIYENSSTDTKIEVKADINAEASHELQTNGKTTKATSDVAGAQTIIDTDSSGKAKVVTTLSMTNSLNNALDIQIEANNDGSAIHKMDINGVVTQATSNIAGAKTVIDSLGDIQTDVDIDASTSVVLKALNDGSSSHEVKGDGFDSKATSQIKGAKTLVAIDGTITTNVDDVATSEGYSKAIVITKPDGTTLTKIVKYDVNDNEIETLTMLGSDEYFEKDNEVTIENDSTTGFTVIKTQVPLNQEIKF